MCRFVQEMRVCCKGKGASASGALASVLDGLGPVRTGPGGALPIHYSTKPPNPKFAERPHHHSTAFYGILTRSARHFCRAERRNMPYSAL